MPQMHFYVPKELAQKIRERADAAQQSVSSYLAELVKREIASEWPEGYIEDVVGGWEGEPLDRPPQGEFETRLPLEPEG